MDVFKHLNSTSKTFIIAEIGQNHQGDINIAKRLIKIAKECGADCVKFQKTCLEEKFTHSALKAPYFGENSWGTTYKEHKEFLEFSEDDFLQLQAYAKEVDTLFTASAMDEKSLEFLKRINVPFIKIGSGDSNNFLLIEKAAQTNIPLVISTGMIDSDTTNEIYNIVSKHHKNFVLLHCVSAYPTPYEDVNLRVIQELQKKFPDILIGYSGHELGIHITVSAVALGARVIERHITLDKNQKGSDHKCSLEPKELTLMIQQIRTLETALGSSRKKIQPSELVCFEKLGKSLVYSKNFKIGHVIAKNDLKVKVSLPKGYNAIKYKDVLGKVLICNVIFDDPVQSYHFNDMKEN
ncbi:hypothetical protein ABEB36_005626 [Hypothenemus hampei]|uniref:N-acetylneuraminate-9-phosphate synthase n=1 Tax=Hypothenemus hampei TaxID=57062 RepID=A0ABD1EYW6_HYPHA